jgi:hypothetical protein
MGLQTRSQIGRAWRPDLHNLVVLLVCVSETQRRKLLTPPSSEGCNTKCQCAAPRAAPGAEVDPKLAAVIAAWPDLPDMIRRGILALATVSSSVVRANELNQ